MNYHRALRQYLEDYQRAGLDRIVVDLPAIVAQPATPSLVAQPPANVVAKPASPTPTPANRAASPPAVAAPAVASAPAQPTKPRATPAAAVTSVPAGPMSDRSITERVAALQVLAGACAACRKCSELAESRTQTVFGVGNPAASIMFVGEAPGADEDRVGEPFVGKAGQLLDKIIGACKLKREEIYICNILRCRPPGNRNPTPEEAANCREFLDGQIGIVDPDYIVCWGGVAAQNLLGVISSVGKLRGTMHQHGRAKVVCTYHPSYLLRNPSAKKQVWEDMKLLFADMDITL